MNTMDRYQAALASFAQAGNRFATIPDLTRFGKLAGLSAEDIINDARSAGVVNRDSCLRKMFDGSTATPGGRLGSAHRYRNRPRKPERKIHPDEVRQRIAVGKSVATSQDIMAASPVPTANLRGADAARALLTAMFKPEDLILVGTMKDGVTDRNLRRVSEWIDDPHLTDYEQVKINPFTGEEADGGSKGKTRIGEKCLARYPLMLLEFDELALEDQCRFWAGMLEAVMPVVAIVYSGGKSLHGLLRVGAADERTWWARCDQAKALYCADPDERYHADLQALRPAVAVRLAGAVRKDTNREQRLLYLNPDAGRTKPAQNAQERPTGREDTKASDDTAKTSQANVGRPDVASAFPVGCADCKTIGDCKSAFGKYWQEKSHGGIGCAHPFAYAKPERCVVWK